MNCNTNTNVSNVNSLENSEIYWALELERISNDIVIFEEHNLF